MYNYKVIAKWNDDKQIVGQYKTIEQAVAKQRQVMNELPLSALNEHITITIESIKHRK